MANLGVDIPLLKICVDNNEDDCDMEILEDGEVEDNSEPEDSYKKSPNVEVNVLVNFAKGMESQVKREQRARRFAAEVINSQICDKDFRELYSSLDIPEEAWISGKTSVRLEALHIRGVDEMNTQDVFKYFSDFSPSSIEWINDTSCNVIWLDRQSAARAMISLTKPIKLINECKRPPKISIKQEVDESSRDGSSEVDETKEIMKLIQDTEDEDMRDLQVTSSESPNKLRAICSSSESSRSSCKSDQEDYIMVNTSEVAVPPGKWRVGLKHEKAKFLLLRFANKGDRKQPGAEKRSIYYMKYGNPNYGGLKGLISSSRKRKFYETIKTENNEVSSETDSEDSSDSNHPLSKDTKKFRMRMIADEEEEALKNKRKIPLTDDREHLNLQTRAIFPDLQIFDSSRQEISTKNSRSTEDLRYKLNRRSHFDNVSSVPQKTDLRSKLEKLRKHKQGFNPWSHLLIHVTDDNIDSGDGDDDE